MVYESGIYIFETIKGEALYIGRSVNLAARISSSFEQRFGKYNEQVFLRCVLRNHSDAALLEVYFIATLKPLLNSDCKYEAPLTLTIETIPLFMERVACFAETASEKDVGTLNQGARNGQ